ncbi:hypothetical protein SAMN05421788_110177 [Filimonas lacunae]|uniref:TerB family tellurite resistance protein n=1 Tax=Filimonas lacunae TaxID=477680 RepID=A0A1N7R8Y6_9BACT|nr:hypothetical protein SAMN05421788_110177 [Filimonas lacunae]
MNKALLIILLLCLPVFSQSQTFSEWFKQNKTQKKYLLAHIAKLQLFLERLKKGYDIAKDGLNLIGTIKDGDFSLHSAFFNHLQTVSPAVTGYSKAAAIATIQTESLQLYRNARTTFIASGMLTAKEQDDCFSIISDILSEIATQVADLVTILTSGQLEMTDHQRITAIDAIYTNSTDTKISFHQFINDITGLISFRQSEQKDISLLESLSR